MILTLQNGRQLYSKWRRKYFLPITSSIFKFLENKCYQRIPQPEMHLKKTHIGAAVVELLILMEQ